MASASLVNSVVGDYRLVDFLGAGGMGEVYRAIHAKIDRVAAVKILTASTPEFRQRFLNEARVHARLHHPNIATLYDLLELGGRPCIIMEYVDGQTLADSIRCAGWLPVAEAWRIYQAVLSAVAYVHDQGIVHRDLKAANIRVSSQGVVKLLDFGIAKGSATPALTQVGNVVGTFMYMPPEQLKGEPADARSDVWALGILLYEMLTGRVPFEAPTVGQLIDKIQAGRYVDLPTLRPAADSEETPLLGHASRVVSRCLKRDPAERYQSAGIMVREVEAAFSRVDGGARLARASSPAARLGSAREWPARFRVLAARVVRSHQAHAAAILVRSAREQMERWRSRIAGGARALRSGARAPRTWTILDFLGRRWAYLAFAALVAVIAAWWSLREPSQAPGDAAGAPSAQAADETLSSYRIDVAEGTAQVYINGVLKGTTPYDDLARPNDVITVELKQEGFVDVRETFDIARGKVWTFAMKRKNERN
ncbi:MAG: serine/threonine-protein kinase [Acidobacteriota bacterium]